MAYDKVIDSAKLEADLTYLADTIRAKGGTSGQLVFPEGMTAAINHMMAALIEREITHITDDTAKKVGQYILYGCQSLKSASFSKATEIGDCAFHSCEYLQSADFPEATSIGGTAFTGCNSLKEAVFPKVTAMKGNAFQNCIALESIVFPLLTALNPYSFTYTKLTEAAFPSAAAVYIYALANNSLLERVILPKAAEIGANAFRQCAKLSTLVLGNTEGVCTLGGTNAFYGTPFASGGSGGTVYVPEALIGSYQEATNWSTLYAAGSCSFQAIEGSEYA